MVALEGRDSVTMLGLGLVTRWKGCAVSNLSAPISGLARLVHHAPPPPAWEASAATNLRRSTALSSASDAVIRGPFLPLLTAAQVNLSPGGGTGSSGRFATSCTLLYILQLDTGIR